MNQKGNGLIIGIIIGAIVAVGLFCAYYLYNNQASIVQHEPESSVPQQISSIISTTPVPTIISVDDTVYYSAQGSLTYYLKYRGQVYTPDNDSSKSIPDPTNFIWQPIKIEIHQDNNDISHTDIFNFYTWNASSYNFIFTVEQGKYLDIYTHNLDNSTTKILTFNAYGPSKDGFNYPKIKQISSDGKYIAFDMYGCWYCEGTIQGELLYNLDTKQTKKIDRTLSFSWNNDRTGGYKYQEYKKTQCQLQGPGECPPIIDVPLQSGMF